MNAQSKKEGPSIILMAAPVALLLLGYGYFFHTPQQRELQQKRRRVQTLSDQEQKTRSDLADARLQLAQAQKRIRTSEAGLKASQETIRTVEVRRTTLQREVLTPTSPASTMQDVTRLLERHGLTVVQSQPAEGSQTKAGDVLKPLLALLEGKHTSAGGRYEGERETYLVTLSGAFPNLRQALQRLSVEQPQVLPLAIEMEESGPRSRTRTWRLTLMV